MHEVADEDHIALLVVEEIASRRARSKREEHGNRDIDQLKPQEASTDSLNGLDAENVIFNDAFPKEVPPNVALFEMQRRKSDIK